MNDKQKVRKKNHPERLNSSFIEVNIKKKELFLKYCPLILKIGRIF